MIFSIQQASPTDLETLSNIEQECFTSEAFSKTQIASLLKAPTSIGLLAKAGGQVVGFIIGLVNDFGEIKLGHIVTIDVVPKYRRKGVGMLMLQEVEREFQNAGVKVCYLEVRADNTAAKKLYQKRGYRQVEVLEDYYYRGEHGIRLEKALLL
jgi:ribosomal-protein-alanine acetyltransferase